MQRNFLEDLGLETDVIDKIMAKNGADIEKAKGDLADKTSALEAANKTIADLQAAVKKFDGVDIDGLNEQISSLKSKYDKDTSELKLSSALDIALVSAKAKNPKMLKAALDMSKIKLDGDKLTGLDEQIAKIKESDGYLFESESGSFVNSGAGHTEGAQSAPKDLGSAIAAHYNKK